MDLLPLKLLSLIDLHGSEGGASFSSSRRSLEVQISEAVHSETVP